MLTSELSARLTAQGLVPAGYSVYRNAFPDTPDKVIALFETGGFGPELFFSGSSYERPGLQVRVRGEANDSDGPRTVIGAIHLAVVGWGGFSQGGVRYLGIQAVESPFLLDRDANQRVHYVVNFLVLKELS